MRKLTLLAIVVVAVACGEAAPDRREAVAAMASHMLGVGVSCAPTPFVAIWAEYDANTPLYDCAGPRRHWCVVEPPEPFRSLFHLHEVADVTGGMYALFHRDAWGTRPGCLRWRGVQQLQSPGE